MQINVKADVQKVMAMLNDTQRNIVPKAASRAINKTLTTVTAEAARQIKQDIGSGISIGFIKSNLEKKQANFNSLYASVTAKGKRLPVIEIDPHAKQTAAGVSYKTRGETHEIPHAFLADMKSGHKGVFTRKDKSRLPISEKYGPSLPKVFTNNAIMTALVNVANQRWQTTFNQEINFLMIKYR